MKKLLAVVLLAASALALADGTVTQVCKASTIKEHGSYHELDDGTWMVECCGTAQRLDGGFVAFLPEHGPCESSIGATRAIALSTCRAKWAAKRCP